MKKRQKEAEEAYEKMWNGGKGSHHPDFDPEAVRRGAVRSPACALLPWQARSCKTAVAHCKHRQEHALRTTQPVHTGHARSSLCMLRRAGNRSSCCLLFGLVLLPSQDGDDVIKGSRETEELYNAIVKVKSPSTSDGCHRAMLAPACSHPMPHQPPLSSLPAHLCWGVTPVARVRVCRTILPWSTRRSRRAQT